MDIITQTCNSTGAGSTHLMWDAEGTTLSWANDKYQALARRSKFLGLGDLSINQVGLAALVADF